MKITIKVGKVEIEYYEETDSTEYPRIITPDKYKDGKTKRDILMEGIKELADKALEIHNKIEYQ